MRTLGFRVRYGRRGTKSTYQSRSAVTRAWESIQKFRTPRWKFVEASRHGRESFSSPEVRTPGGFFVQTPYGLNPKKYIARYEKGKMTTGVVKGGGLGRRDVTVRLNPWKLVRDPKGHVADILKRIKPHRHATVSVMVKGRESMANYGVDFFRDSYFKAFVSSLRKGGMTGKRISETFFLRVT